MSLQDREARSNLLAAHANADSPSPDSFGLAPPSRRIHHSAQRYAHEFPERLRNSRKLQCLAGALALCFVLVTIWVFSPATSERHPPPEQHAGAGRPFYVPAPTEQRVQKKYKTGKGKHRGVINYTFGDGSVFEKPADVKVYGLVFYGRWDRVQILDCYIRVRGFAEWGGGGIGGLIGCVEKPGLEWRVLGQGHLCRQHQGCGRHKGAPEITRVAARILPGPWADGADK